MSIYREQRLAVRLAVFMALAVAASLLLVGWSLDRPAPSLAPRVTPTSLDH